MNLMGGYVLSINSETKGYFQCQERLTSYVKSGRCLVPYPTQEEGWEQYIRRAAIAVGHELDKMQIWDILPEITHTEVKIRFYSKTNHPGEISQLVAEVAVRSGEYKLY